MSCNHKVCGNIQKIWLTCEFRGQINGLKAHPYCLQCGTIKNISSDRAKSLGYYMNILSDLHITKVQARLIVKSLEALGGFDDTFSMSRFAQERVFINIVKNYSCLSENSIKVALEHHL